MWYLFGIIKLEKPIDFAVGGFAGYPLRAIPFQELGVVAQELPEWTINESQKADLLEKLLIHQKTLETVMRETFVLPIKFGCVVDSEEAIRNILEKGHPLFSGAVQELSGKMEINLTVTWDVSAQLRDIAGTDPGIQAMKEKASREEDRDFLVTIGRALEVKLEERRGALATQIFQKLDGHHEGRLDHECLENRIILNSSFLISREKEECFSAAVMESDQELQGALHFKCLMPLPPHSFRTIAIQRISPSTLHEAMKLFDVRPETTLTELKEKNRQLIQQFHPDKKPDSEKVFSLVHQSFGLLKDLYALEEKPFANMNPDHCFAISTIQGEIHDS